MKATNLNVMKVITSEAQFLDEVDGTEIDIVDWGVTLLHIGLTKAITERFDFLKTTTGFCYGMSSNQHCKSSWRRNYSE